MRRGMPHASRDRHIAPILGQTRIAEAFAVVLLHCRCPIMPPIAQVDGPDRKRRELATLPAVPLAEISYEATDHRWRSLILTASYGTVRTFFVAYLPRVPPIEISATPRYWPASVGEYEQTAPLAAVPDMSTHALVEFARFCHFEL